MVNRTRVEWGLLGVQCLLGVSVMVYTGWHYPLGSLRQMGPGFLPFTLGGLLLLLGVGQAWGLWRRQRPLTPPIGGHSRALAYVLASVLVLGLGLERVGVLPSVFVAVWLSTQATPGWLLRHRLLLALCTAVGSALLFVQGLGLPLSWWAVWW